MDCNWHVPIIAIHAFLDRRQETTMSPPRIPGNEPDPNDMSTEPDITTPSNQPSEHDLPDDEAEKLGDFA